MEKVFTNMMIVETRPKTPKVQNERNQWNGFLAAVNSIALVIKYKIAPNIIHKAAVKRSSKFWDDLFSRSSREQSPKMKRSTDAITKIERIRSFRGELIFFAASCFLSMAFCNRAF